MKPVFLFFALSFALLALDNPVEFHLKKSSGSDYLLSISVPKKYAIQIEAPHKVKLTGEKGVKVESYDTKLTGPVKLGKPEYYEKVDDLKVKLTGKGDLLIDSKIFYCDLEKNVCYPAKISKTEKVK